MGTINKQRAGWAKRGLLAFAVETGQAKEINTKANMEEAISDLVADLLHLCDEYGIDADSVIDRARNNHQIEVIDDE